MDSELNILSIVLIVFCILQIILFFKIWAMTNNVKDISEYLFAVKILLLKSSDPKTKISHIKTEAFRLLTDKYSFRVRDDEALKNRINESVSSIGDQLQQIIEKYNGEDYYNIEKLKEDFFNYIK